MRNNATTQTIWRYMSLAKYVDMLSSRSVFCCRANLFDDQTEGEWFSQIVATSHKNLTSFWGKCYQAIKKVNQHVFSLPHPTVADIGTAFQKLISEDERNDLDVSSDDVQQVTDERFFDSIERSEIHLITKGEAGLPKRQKEYIFNNP